MSNRVSHLTNPPFGEDAGAGELARVESRFTGIAGSFSGGYSLALISSLIDEADPRAVVIRDGEVQSNGCVLLWVQRSQRAYGNHAVNVAVDLANKLQLPVVAAFCLVDSYPSATLRAYHFMAEGLAELPDAFRARGIGWVLRPGDPVQVIPKLVADRQAVVVVSDMAPTRDARAWKAAIADQLQIPFVLVDGDVVIPTDHFTKLEWAPRTIRSRILPLLDTYIQPIPDPIAHVPSNVRESPDPFALIGKLTINRSVGPSPRVSGGQNAARKRLTWFVENHLESYEEDRNRSDIDGTSGLSPYLHFGQISPVEIAVAARDSFTDPGHPSRSSFFNELIVQRELCINFALHEPNYDRYEGIPDWARKSLDAHRNDPRPVLYPAEMLESAQTGDRLWNAAQLQMVHEGYMPNRLRMYWAKQLLYWTSSPEAAFAIAVELNDRYFVDGRDPNGYAGISWSIGGRHDRPFPPNKPILGLVRPMGIKAMKRYFDVEAYVASIDARYGPV